MGSSFISNGIYEREIKILRSGELNLASNRIPEVDRLFF
ncbi:hypothetical protein LEP1GSC061_1041 [Leptospira wolffii serovar Khorat str. Khorat-H2]|nr:hypothetical protein LEP1GSC061_1041 [Leptospira wolffii serovar Khorat str. Khorat-H2]